MDLDAVVLAGGRGSRLGGLDKAALRIGGTSLLDRVLLACASAARTVVVGPARPTVRDVEWTREDPPGTGPVAALAAGIQELSGSPRDVVLVLATDLYRLAPGDVARLLHATSGHDGALFVDAGGRRQPLAAAYRRASLAAVLAEGPPQGRAVRDLVRGLRLCEVPDAGAAADCDTLDDLASARGHAG